MTAVLTRPEVSEWDVEFARVCDAALPFERCAAHVGSEGWERTVRSYGDLQVRAYDLVGAGKAWILRLQELQVFSLSPVK